MGLLRLVAPYEPPCHCCTSRAFCHRLSVEKGRYIYIDTESAGFFFHHQHQQLYSSNSNKRTTHQITHKEQNSQNAIPRPPHHRRPGRRSPPAPNRHHRPHHRPPHGLLLVSLRLASRLRFFRLLLQLQRHGCSRWPLPGLSRILQRLRHGLLRAMSDSQCHVDEWNSLCVCELAAQQAGWRGEDER